MENEWTDVFYINIIILIYNSNGYQFKMVLSN